MSDSGVHGSGRAAWAAAAWLVCAICLVCAACLAQPATGADPKQWVSIGIGGGGGIFLPAGSPHDPNLIFCSSDMGGVYRSADGGKSWQMLPWRQLSSAYACPITYHPTDPNTLYNVQGPWARQLLKVSTDKGLTWRPLTEQTPWAESGQVNQIGIDPENNVLLVSAEKAAFRSDDNGKSWTQCQGIEAKVLGFFFAPRLEVQLQGLPPTRYAGTVAGVLKSDDKGKTWTPCPSQPGRALVAFCGGGSGKTGESAMYASVPTSVVEGKLAGGIFRSADGGKTWQSAMGKGITTAVKPAPASAPSTQSGRRERLAPEFPFLAMATNQSKTAYAWCYGTTHLPPDHTSVYRTDDGGQSWRAVLFGPQDLPGQNVELPWRCLDVSWNSEGGGVLSFAVNPANSEVVSFTNMMEIFITTDGGKSWRQIYTRCTDGRPRRGAAWSGIGLEMTTTWQFKSDPHDPKRVYICYTDIGFCRSEDRGQSWYYSTAGSPWTNTFYDIAFDPDKPGVVYAAAGYEHDIPSWKMAERVYGSGGVCLSADYGKTWKPISNGLPTLGPCMAVALDPDSPKDKRTLYCAMYGGGAYKSSDGGATWQARNEGLKTEQNDHFSDLKRHKDGTLLALCTAKRKERESLAPGGLFKSVDGGQTWTDLTADLKLRHPYGFDVDPTDSKVIYLGACAAPRHHDEAGLYKSTDGGKTWTKLQVPWPESDISYYHVMFPSVDPYNHQRVWIGAGTHGLMVTTDAGKTWREVKGCPFRIVSRISVDPQDHETIWVTTFGGGVWKGPAMGTD